jgi:hypothetical protein
MQRFNYNQKVPHHLSERLDKWFMHECASAFCSHKQRLTSRHASSRYGSVGCTSRATVTHDDSRLRTLLCPNVLYLQAYDELPDFIKPAVALRSNMGHIKYNALFLQACGIDGEDSTPSSVAVHVKLTERLVTLLKCGHSMLRQQRIAR